MTEVLNLIYLTIGQLVITWILAGIMWFAQVVHYPLYKKIKEGFVEYERAHIRRAAFLLAPLMLFEIISAILLIGVVPEGMMTRFASINLILLMVIWLSTFLFQVTQHQKLSVRFSKKIIQGLIHSNWIRTLLWTAKGIVMILMTNELFHLSALVKKLLES